VKKCEIWSWLSTPVAFDAPLFQNETNTDLTSKTDLLSIEWSTIQYNRPTMSISRAPWCLRWVGTEALGEVTLRPKSRKQLWTVRFSVLIWRWPSCHFGERRSVERSTLMVQRRWKPACRCWSGFAEQAVEVRRKTAAAWLTHDAAAAAQGSLATTRCAPYTWGAPLCLRCASQMWHSSGHWKERSGCMSPPKNGPNQIDKSLGL